MKERPKFFLAQINISHDSEAFDYIRELHEYLWIFVRCYIPGASGVLSDHLDKAIKMAKAKAVPKTETTEEKVIAYTLQRIEEMERQGYSPFRINEEILNHQP